MLNKIESGVVFIIISLHFSYIFSYLGIAVSTAFDPLKLFMANIVLTGLLMMLRPSSFTYIFKLPIYRWMLFYFVIILIWIMLPNAHASYKNIREIILYIIVLFTITTLIYFDDAKLSASRKAILVVTLLSVIINIYEFFVPDFLFPAGHDRKIFGRSAGLYFGASASSQAICLGLIFSYGIVREKFKTLFLFATLIGIIATFSRSGILSWFLIVFVFSFQKTINKKGIIIITLILVMISGPLLNFLIDYINNNLGGATGLLSRVSDTSLADDSTNKRLLIAKAAWGYFADNPLTGAGIGYTKHWEFNVAPHNTYLKLMAEYGIIGFFIFISLVFVSIWKARGEAGKIAQVFAIYSLMIGFFTHGILEAVHFLVTFALMANMSYRSRLHPLGN